MGMRGPSSTVSTSVDFNTIEAALKPLATEGVIERHGFAGAGYGGDFPLNVLAYVKGEYDPEREREIRGIVREAIKPAAVPVQVIFQTVK